MIIYNSGDTRLTHTNAIMRYIACHHDLLGKTDEERIRIAVLIEQCSDFRNALIRLAHDQHFVRNTVVYISYSVYKNNLCELKNIVRRVKKVNNISEACVFLNQF